MSQDLFWQDGVPVSARFDDPFYARADGLAETRHVFLAGCDLPERFAEGFHVAELGFGTGLNLLATWAAWRRAGIPGPLRYTSFEAFPMTPADIARAHAAFADVAEEAAVLTRAWSGAIGPVRCADLILDLRIGDARQTVPAWTGLADAWYLDGFAPARNPEMWEPELLAAVAARLRPGGRLATYSAAGHVRRALGAAGLDVARRAGFGRKRHMTAAVRPVARGTAPG